MPRKKKTELDDLMKYMKQIQDYKLQLSTNPEDIEAKMNLQIAEARAEYFREKIDRNLLRQLEEIDQPKGASREEMIKSATDFRDSTYPESNPLERYQREALTAYIDFLANEK
ncbi:hypothetical protein FC52_GL001616 [Lactobacillus pasteurii DSM 23907 = CRBIP 24.76]|uniref:Uncharacterized protein n=1 Tax=Lactobacillus pasteurii DSM 23907 = CRBIP 24.76 TaxID=1423790 RepID=I7LAI8_9LACO|nr:hypothetical protein [Lactobacillus pasteurii]KRK07726.1 hypothetical protein FC52_GL001616 [Lactobacillus pasteurii DSM 23907 = CRBIP 24.76]TDG77736.1 hypothetical protein C5L33_000147 [Lactobacillus pasteurii]CCI84736.1 Protein of unknown function [Lactobacillus pasteurii DSM 23907 = CRBIP 24.76]